MQFGQTRLIGDWLKLKLRDELPSHELILAGADDNPFVFNPQDAFGPMLKKDLKFNDSPNEQEGKGDGCNHGPNRIKGQPVREPAVDNHHLAHAQPDENPKRQRHLDLPPPPSPGQWNGRVNKPIEFRFLLDDHGQGFQNFAGFSSSLMRRPTKAR
ncbi:MAG TPA: hypothetical protein VNN22_00170 [Verrucomicrobiae bacterium]|nr:hypothetical protein [Verrucomicrobiae bacterium]